MSYIFIIGSLYDVKTSYYDILDSIYATCWTITSFKIRKRILRFSQCKSIGENIWADTMNLDIISPLNLHCENIKICFRILKLVMVKTSRIYAIQNIIIRCFASYNDPTMKIYDNIFKKQGPKIE